jgi:hypothetical protein
MDERAAIVEYIRSFLIKEPVDDVENHMNYVINLLAQDIKQGAHEWVPRESR